MRRLLLATATALIAAALLATASEAGKPEAVTIAPVGTPTYGVTYAFTSSTSEAWGWIKTACVQSGHLMASGHLWYPPNHNAETTILRTDIWPELSDGTAITCTSEWWPIRWYGGHTWDSSCYTRYDQLKCWTLANKPTGSVSYSAVP